MNNAVIAVLGSLSLLLVAGCPDSSDPDDDTAIPDDDACDDDGGDDDSTDGPQQAVAAQARLVQLEAGDPFIGGPGASAREGDYLVSNNFSRYVIRGQREADLHVGAAGAVIDADIARFSDQADRDSVYEVLTLLGPSRVFVADAFEVVNDGSRTGDLVELIATGTDVPMELLAEVSGSVDPPLGLEVRQTYVLTPGNPTLSIRTQIRNETGALVDVQTADLIWYDGDAYDLFAPGIGFVDEPVQQQQTMLGLLSRRNDNGFAVFGFEDHITPGTLDGMDGHYDHVVAWGPSLSIPDDDQQEYNRGIGVDMDLAALDTHRRSRWGLSGQGAIEGRVRPPGSNVGIGGVRIFLTDTAGNPQMVAVTGNFGGYKMQGDPGDWYLVAVGEGNNEDFDFHGGFGTYGGYATADRNELALRAFEAPETVLPVPFADGYRRSDPIAITVEDDRIHEEFEYAPPATLSLRVENGDGQPIAATVRVGLAGTDPHPPDWRLGENRPADGSRKVIWLHDGEADIPIAPGTYDLTAHRGFRDEIATEENLSLVSGQHTEVTLVVQRAFETPGYVSADLDTHAALSVDGRCSIEERLATAAASDVQVHLATERDHVVDYTPVLEAMGLADVLMTVPGLEVETPRDGRFNVYPLTPDTTSVNGGAVRWWEVGGDTQDLVDEMHALGDVLVQVNAGRADGGMLDNAHYNASNGSVGRPDRYTSEFEVLEVLNGQHVEDIDPLRLDWCSHLDQGLRPTAVGASDAHDRLGGTGSARTYIAVGTDDVSELDPDDLFDALRGGHAVVSGGPFVLLEAEAPGGAIAGVGETLSAGSATLHIQVMAPSWMDLDTVRVYTDGCQLVDSFSVGASAPPVRFETDLAVSPGGAAYYFVEVEGTELMGPVWPDASPYAMTNPVFLDP